LDSAYAALVFEAIVIEVGAIGIAVWPVYVPVGQSLALGPTSGAALRAEVATAVAEGLSISPYVAVKG
jgi:hypothetical protein